MKVDNIKAEDLFAKSMTCKIESCVHNDYQSYLFLLLV